MIGLVLTFKRIFMTFRTAAFTATFIVTACLGTAALLFAAEPPASQAAKTQTKPSGLQITTTAPPVGAKDGDTVSVIYTGKFANGQEFDSSAKHGGDPIEFMLGKKMVIQGWDEGLQGMQVGEKRTLVIPPEIAYGKDGSGPIPPNSTLTFDVELVGLKRPAQK